MILNSNALPNIIEAVKEELDTNEEIYYLEQPVGHKFRLSLLWDYNAALVYFSILFFIINWGKIQSDLGYTIIALSFTSGTSFVLFIAFIIWLNARRTAYVVTSHRVFTLHLERNHSHVISFTPEQFNDRTVQNHMGGAGNLCFHKEVKPDQKGTPVTSHHGFHSVPDIEKLEKAFDRLVRENQNKEIRR